MLLVLEREMGADWGEDEDSRAAADFAVREEQRERAAIVCVDFRDFWGVFLGLVFCYPIRCSSDEITAVASLKDTTEYTFFSFLD